MAFNEVLARLSVVLGMDTAAFSTGSARAKKEVSTLERHVSRASGVIKSAVVGMLGAFAVDQIIAAAKESLDYAASLGEVAAQLGVTTKELQEFRYAATQTGIEQGEMDKALAKLSRTIGEAIGGSKSAAATFEKMGISLRDSNGNVRSTGDVLADVADAYNKAGSAAEGSALSAEVFGSKLGQKLNPLLAEGAKGVKSLRDRAAEMGLVIDQALIDKADKASDNLGVLADLIKLKFTVAIVENAEEINDLAEELIGLVSAIGSVRNEWRKLQLTMQQFDILTEPIGTSSWSSRMERIGTLQREKDIYNGEAYERGRRAAEQSAARQRDIEKWGPKLGGIGAKAPFSIAPKATWPGTNRAVGGSAFGGLDLSQFTPGSGTRGWMTAANDQFAGIAAKSKEAETAVANMANVHGPRLVDSIKKAKPELENLRSATQSILDRLFPETAEVNRYREELATLTAALKAGQLTTEDYAKAVDALRQEFTGFTDLIAQNQEIVAEGVGTTLDDALDSATASWDRFADGLSDRSDVTRVEVVKNFDQMAQDVLSSLGQLSGAIRGGGFLDILSGVLGLGLQVAGLFRHDPNAFKTPTPPVINNFRGPAYANGTSFHRGGLAVVGERGPELVNLPRGVGVTPNKDLRGMGGGIAEIVPSKYFDVVVDGRIVRASPAIMDGSAKVTTSRLGRRQKRQLYG